MTEKFFSDGEVAAIRRHYKETVPQNQRLTDKELETAMLVAEKRKLYPPPLGNHIYFMKRANRQQLDDGSWGDVPTLSLQTGIDGLRLIAERTNKYVGSGVPEYEHDPQGFVKRAIIHVQKLAPDGQRATISADAFFDEYVQYKFKKGGEKSVTAMWNEKGHLMLSKCAEALALRKAFPELSGLYTTDEMGSQEHTGDPEAEVTTPPPAVQKPQPALPPTQAAPTPPPAQAETPRPTPAAAAPAPAVASPTATAPASSAPSSGYTLADPERKKKLANALALACSTFKVTRTDMVKNVRAWGGRVGVISEAGAISQDLTAGEFDSIKNCFVQFETEKRGVKPVAVSIPVTTLTPEATAELAASEWERRNAPIADDEIPF
jgi:phage recombination protein Bet